MSALSIVDIAHRVFAALGPDHVEFTYQRAMEIELRNHNYRYENEKRVSVYYRDSVGRLNTLAENRIDFYVYGDGDTIVELKSIARSIRPRDLEQVKRYRVMLRHDNLHPARGLLINFPCNKDAIEVLSMDFDDIGRVDDGDVMANVLVS